MATATAKRGQRKGAKEPTKPPKPNPPKKRASRTKGQAKSPVANSAFLQTVKAENPDITSDEFAIKFNMPPDEVARHRAFINQYVRDYNPTNAALRMGYPEGTAGSTAKILLGNAFAQLYLAEIQRAATLETVVTVGQIAARLWQEANAPDVFGSTSASTRIGALNTLAKATGMLDKKPTDDKPQVVRRIMYVAEEIVDWEQHARASQKALKASTVIDV